MRFALLILLACLLLPAPSARAQRVTAIPPNIEKGSWDARWITYPGIKGTEYGVYNFRKSFVLPAQPKTFIVHVSGDNRYKLYVNGQYISQGPATGDLMHWQFDSYDLAPYLRQGVNTLAALVWNFADLRPVFQATYATGFIVQGNGPAEAVCNTDRSWRVARDDAYSPLTFDTRDYYVVGPGEQFDSARHPWHWRESGFDDSKWAMAEEGDQGRTLKSMRQYGQPAPRILTPRSLPLMEETRQGFDKIRRSEGMAIPASTPNGQQPLTIPPNSTVKLLLDQGHLTNAYPVIDYSGGQGGSIRITYAESMIDTQGEKGNRDVIEGKTIFGKQDIILPDGGSGRSFQTLWWRTFRYVEIAVATRDQALKIENIHSIFTGYPFRENASFNSNLPFTRQIWDVGWRTQRLCAGETFFDCPYYEQLQYVGDTRIQCLVSTYVSGDTTLFRNALLDLKDSRLPFGLTQSRYPSREEQIIPPFSLIWVDMLWDYWMLCRDRTLIRKSLPAVMEVLSWYEKHIDEEKMLGPMEWWNFMDWVEDEHWDSGAPPGVHDSHSAILNLHYVYALQKAVPLLNAYGYPERATHYAQLADSLRKQVYARCYDAGKGLLADVPEKTSFSQHANILGILTGTFPDAEQPAVMDKIITDSSLAPASYYYQFYLFEALEKAGRAEAFIPLLQPWQEMIAKGLTTFAEKPDPTRSDCHAWSASPLYYFLSLVCGIQPGDPGFETVRISPHPGELQDIEGVFPHRLGMLRLSLKKDDEGSLSGNVELPAGLSGTYQYRDYQKNLVPGINTIP